jgi:hypothetical protein
MPVSGRCGATRKCGVALGVLLTALQIVGRPGPRRPRRSSCGRRPIWRSKGRIFDASMDAAGISACGVFFGSHPMVALRRIGRTMVFREDDLPPSHRTSIGPASLVLGVEHIERVPAPVHPVPLD